MKIVQIGTNSANDDLSDFIKGLDYIEKLVLVEPLDLHNDNIIRCYEFVDNVYIENSIITDDISISECDIYYHENDGPFYEIASLSKEHILKHSIYNPNLTEEGIKKISIPSLTINELFEKHSLFDIDLVFIDVEGLDDKLIYSIDFSRFNINTIIYENLHINNERLIDYLIDNGYQVNEFIGSNGWSNKAVKV